MSNLRYILPTDTAKLIDLQAVDNFMLKLNKTPPFEENKKDYSKSKFIFFKVNGKGKVKLNVQPDYSKLDIKAIAERHNKAIKKLKIAMKSITLEPEWRMVVGLGNESVYETSMTLHHIYGIPYIPGQAVKGVVRNYIITEKFNQHETNAWKDEGFCLVFGSPKDSKIGEHIGAVIFFDAFPLKGPYIEPDVMNVHYSDYYDGTKPPADYQNPKPIFFLTVKKTPFSFILGIKEKYKVPIRSGIFKGHQPIEVAYNYMKEALLKHGIGAKTAVGYGYMTLQKDKR